MVTGEIDEGIDELEWETLCSCGISKEVTVGGIRNVNIRGKSTTIYIVENTEVMIEASTHLRELCGNIQVTGKAGSLGNNIGTKRVGSFGDNVSCSLILT